MMNSYLSARGDLVEPAELRIPKARDLAQTLLSSRLAFVSLVECRHEDSPDETEVVIVNIEVERGQRTVHDIRHIERVAIRFFAHDRWAPEVLALREDFPVVPHLNLRPQALPRSLCLFDEPYDEIKLHWTAAWFAERIRTWLAQTARGELHTPDQPLEPLLLGAATPLILPANLFEQFAEQPVHLVVYALKSSGGKLTYMTVSQEREELQGAELPCIATVLAGHPQPHGIIRQLPRNISELHDFMETADVDVLGCLRERLKQWQRETAVAQILARRLIIIIALPKTRAAGASIEATDIYAFVSTEPLSIIGEQIGAWQLWNGKPGTLLGADATRCGEDVGLVALNPMLAFSREAAATFSGLPAQAPQPVAAIGLGALGSQVFMNLLRMGVAPWSLIDKDIMLPHNLARHTLDAREVGYAKAQTLAVIANHMLNNSHAATALVIDVLHPGEHAAELTQAFTGATVILDMAASVPVARAVACDYESSARRISLFLNPSGTDLVLLAEDTERTISLDMLEMQYYRLLVENDDLHRHLQSEGRPQRYARSCRDLSAMIPQDLMGLHAGIGSRAFRIALAQPAAHISVWQANPDKMTVVRIEGNPAPLVVQHEGNWTILTDTWVLEQLNIQRQERLPNETGGVLIGAIDQERQRIYIVLSLPSPPDSVEWPTLYIRGCQGLRQRVEEIDAITVGQLFYIGEWHSHPRGHGCTPSSDDQRVLEWLANERAVDGLPGLMAIVGDSGLCWYLETMCCSPGLTIRPKPDKIMAI